MNRFREYDIPEPGWKAWTGLAVWIALLVAALCLGGGSW